MGNASMNLIRHSKPLDGKTGFFAKFDAVVDGEYGEATDWTPYPGDPEDEWGGMSLW